MTRQTSISELQISVDLKVLITSGLVHPPAGNFTFQVSEPTIAVVLHDTQGVVPSGSSRYIGTKVNFEIQTNLDSIVSQRGVSDRNGIINMYVRSPNGITYTSLFTSDTVSKILIDLTGRC